MHGHAADGLCAEGRRGGGAEGPARTPSRRATGCRTSTWRRCRPGSTGNADARRDR
ncbi:MAG: hypothetical protein M0C28_32995 [Candidatus Moduliflexus flocculans]|nr:hypothetical protein [Candidatus Moduliflexus flocculans]